MAAEKKSFVLYADSYGLIKQLPDDLAGRLLKHIFAYVNDENPFSEELLLNIAFEPIKMHLKRDLKKFELIKEKRSIAGKKSAELRQQNAINSTHVDFVQQTSTNPTVSVSDNDSVSESVSVSDIVSTDVDVIPNTFDNSKNLLHSLGLKNEALQWQETVAMQLKIAPAEIPKKLDEFTTFLSTTFKEHKNKKEFISHFINWLPKNLNEKIVSRKQGLINTND